jgi:glycosyltransferase involved in cell wall biosynthesis
MFSGESDLKISVVIPSWNRADFLPNAIDSVLNQTIPVYEVLICDDGSTDNSKHIVELFGDARVKWLPGDHVGMPAVPRNRGIRAAKGDWIAFLDSDDIWLPDKLKMQFEYLKNTNMLATSSNALIFDVQKNSLKLFFSKSKPIKNINFSNLISVNTIITSTVILHRSLLDRVGLFSESNMVRGIEDYDLWLRVTTFSSFLYLPEPLAQYRDDVAFSARAHGGSQFGQKLRSFINYSNWIIKTYPTLFLQIIVFFKINIVHIVSRIYYKFREVIGLLVRKVKNRAGLNMQYFNSVAKVWSLFAMALAINYLYKMMQLAHRFLYALKRFV